MFVIPRYSFYPGVETGTPVQKEPQHCHGASDQDPRPRLEMYLSDVHDAMNP